MQTHSRSILYNSHIAYNSFYSKTVDVHSVVCVNEYIHSLYKHNTIHIYNRHVRLIDSHCYSVYFMNRPLRSF